MLTDFRTGELESQGDTSPKQTPVGHGFRRDCSGFTQNTRLRTPSTRRYSAQRITRV